MKASEWEYFQDEAYYGMYAVRTKENRSFTRVIHVRTAEEAIFLTNSLNYIVELQELGGKCHSNCSKMQEVIDYISQKEGWEETGDIYRKHFGFEQKYSYKGSE